MNNKLHSKLINKKSKILFFGYPAKSMNYTGGFLWIKKVADLIDNSNRYSVLKSYAYGDSKKAINRLFNKFYDVARIILFIHQILQ